MVDDDDDDDDDDDGVAAKDDEDEVDQDAGPIAVRPSTAMFSPYGAPVRTSLCMT
jgi:hypothetical protein